MKRAEDAAPKAVLPHVNLQHGANGMPALVLYKDVRNRVLRVNQVFTQALNRSSSLTAVNESTRHLLLETTARNEADLEVLRTGEAQLRVIESIEIPHQGQRWYETDRLPQLDEKGRVIGLVVVSHDITERKNLEGQLRQAQKLESIGKLAGGVAHDFNNMLTSLFGLIAAAQRSVPSDSMAHEYLALMQLAAEGGANFTRQLLAFARREIIEPRVVDLNELVRETSALLSRVFDAHIGLVDELCAEAVPVRVDPSQISQLLMNLALNARDAMREPGTLVFRTERLVLDEPESRSLHLPSGRYAVLTVRDSGEGLSEEAKEHLFEPFFTSKALGHGTGLGLATCYGIVKQNHGHITAESQRGVGTSFSIYLPEADAPVEAHRPEARQPVRAGNETVLFVEDDDLVRYLSVSALASAGYRMIEANHGEEALHAARQHPGPIHLLVTDVIMPKMGGVELSRRFRELQPDAGVLYITGYAGDALAEVGSNVDVLKKPFTNNALLHRVREVLDKLSENDACHKEAAWSETVESEGRARLEPSG